jgi:hypothetical protein
MSQPAKIKEKRAVPASTCSSQHVSALFALLLNAGTMPRYAQELMHGLST